MKFVYPEIEHVFETDACKVPTLVIENQVFLLKLLNDIQNQLDGFEGLSVLSKDNKILKTDSSVELITSFVPFKLNQKNLLNKISRMLADIAVSDVNYEKTAGMLSELERFMMDISFELSCDISFDRISIDSVIKAASPVLKEDYDSLGEKIIDYMELVTEIENQKKLFIFLNLRSFISDDETEKFIETAINHEYNILMIESREHPRLKNENRLIIDNDLCEIY